MNKKVLRETKSYQILVAKKKAVNKSTSYYVVSNILQFMLCLITLIEIVNEQKFFYHIYLILLMLCIKTNGNNGTGSL
jgi:hypothetical protein